ncbi:MAG: hypothetical protein U0169_16640 [Polyangiaceae bacterium]
MRSLVSPPSNSPKARASLVILDGLAFAVPALVAASFAWNTVDAAHDTAAVRALALGPTGLFRALDGLLAQLALGLPVGDRAFRGALVSVAFSGIFASILFRLVLHLLRRAGGEGRLVPFVAMVATIAVAASPPVLAESVVVGGSILGAVLVLAPLFHVVTHRQDETEPRIGAAFLLGAAVAYEPFVGLAAGLALGSYVGMRSFVRRTVPVPSRATLVAFAIGLAPLLWAFVRTRTASPFALGAPLGHAWQGETPWTTKPSIANAVLADVGPVLLAAGAFGTAFAAVFTRTRALAFALVVVVAVAFAAASTGAPLGASRTAPVVLAAYGAIGILASVMLHRLVRWIGSANVPFAAASAVMVVLLEAAIPVRSVDDAVQVLARSSPRRVREWEELAWDTLPLGSTVLVPDALLLTRFLSARAQGSLRSDLALLPTFDLSNALVLAELTREPKLTPLVRDLFLGNVPDEWSLSSLSSSRPLAVTFDPKWDKTLSRHLLPSGLFARFESEPRGTVDRRQGLVAFQGERERLARAVGKPVDRELTALTLHLLRARVLALASASDRELTALAIEDVRAFDPKDDVARAIEERMAKKAGTVDTSGLSP